MEKDVFRIDEVKVVKVIHVKCARGSGTEKDPVRFIDQYWDLKGNLLAERDCERNTNHIHKEIQDSNKSAIRNKIDECLFPYTGM